MSNIKELLKNEIKFLEGLKKDSDVFYAKHENFHGEDMDEEDEEYYNLVDNYACDTYAAIDNRVILLKDILENFNVADEELVKFLEKVEE